MLTSIIVTRLARERPSLTTEPAFSMKEVFRSLSSVHVILVLIQMFCIGTTLFGLALFLPSIVKQLGFSATRTQLVSVGPFAAGFLGKIQTIFMSSDLYSYALIAPYSNRCWCILLRQMSQPIFGHCLYWLPGCDRVRDVPR